MKRHLLLLLILTACVYVAPAAEPTLESLTQIYKKQVQAIEDQHMEALGRISAQYGADLNRAIEILKKEGDPDQALAGIAEKKRFEVELQGPSSVGEKLPTIIQKCQEKYRNAAKTASVAKGKQFVALTDRYVRALDSLMRKLTADGKFQQAVKVKEEKAKVGFALADVETKLKAIDVGTNKATMMPLSLRRGLLLHYGFDADGAGKVVDKSGKKNHGDVKGARWTKDGCIGGGLDFFQVKQFIDLGSSILETRSPSHSMSITACVLPRRTSGVSWLVSQYKMPPNPDRFSFSMNNGDLAYFKGGKNICSSGAGLASGKWQTVAVTKASNGTILLYLNGKKIGSGTCPGKYADSNTRIGGRPDDTRYGLDGKMDEVMIWNRVLSEDEIKQVHRLTKGE